MLKRLARPDVSDLVLSVHQGALHPEIFVAHRSITRTCDRLRLDAQIVDAGHVLTLRIGKRTWTEYIANRLDPLPRQFRIYQCRLNGSKSRSIELDSGASYSVNSSLERLSPTEFLRYQEELLNDSSKASLTFTFAPTNRFTPVAISHLQAELWSKGALVYAAHTFPDHLSVVKTQTLLSLE